MREHHNSTPLNPSDAVADMFSEAMDSLDHEHDKVSTRIDPEDADFAMVMALMFVGILAVSFLA